MHPDPDPANPPAADAQALTAAQLYEAAAASGSADTEATQVLVTNKWAGSGKILDPGARGLR